MKSNKMKHIIYNGAWSLYLRPQLPVSDNLTLSLRAGFGAKYFDRTVDNPNLAPTDRLFQINDKSTLGRGALGAGVEYSFGEQKVDSLRLDLTRRFHIGSLSDGNEEACQDSQLTVSYARRF